MRITGKLLVLVVVPLVAVVAFAGLALVSAGGQALRADRLRSLVVAGQAAGELAYRLQVERVAAVEALVGRPAGAVDAYLQKAAATDRAVNRFGCAQSELSQVPDGVRRLLDRVDGGIGQFSALRERVASGKGAASALVFAYRIVIADLVSYPESVAPRRTSPTGSAGSSTGGTSWDWASCRRPSGPPNLLSTAIQCRTPNGRTRVSAICNPGRQTRARRDRPGEPGTEHRSCGARWSRAAKPPTGPGSYVNPTCERNRHAHR